MEKQGCYGEEGLFFRENNRRSISLADRDYVYYRRFDLPSDWLTGEDHSEICLEADGLDTLCEIRLNGRLVGKTANMHRQYAFPVRSFLTEGENSIEILFRNSLDFIRKEHKRRPLWIDGDDGVTTVEGFEMIRKSHCSYGWDWGPQVPDLGIWRDIRLCRYETARITDFYITQKHEKGAVDLTLFSSIGHLAMASATAECRIYDPEGELIHTLQKDFTAGDVNWEGKIRIDNPRLWWINGLGEQPLYRVEILLADSEGNRLDQTERTIGLRTLTVEQLPDEWGETFHFTINGQPVFSRGANYIPEDVFLRRTSAAERERLVRDCAEANFNTLRVWGGGVYPDDEFYDLCDRYGLIVWQDLMFACAIYDVREDSFIQEITCEIEDNLRRIRHHPCIGLICGNNEMEWAFVNWDRFVQTREQEFEYLKQYHVIIPEIHQRICPELFYWPSSPSSTGYFEEPNDPNRGDCHFWEVWHSNKDYTEYKNHYFRFMSEFGFESLPCIETIESFTLPEDRNLFSPVMEEHQKRIGGNPKILAYLSKYYRYPSSLDHLAYVSQISQSEAIKAGVQHWRRNRGRCMGAVYWQLNDNWPVASWSSVDYYGRWKMLHYEAKRSYHNILLSIDGDEESCAVHLSCESFEGTEGTLTVRILHMTTGEVLYGEKKTVGTEPFSSHLVHEISREVIRGIGSEEKRDCMVRAEFRDERSGESFRTCHYFLPWKYLNLPEPEISCRVKKDSDGRIIEVSSQRASLYTELKGRDRIFSDNYFDLAPGETREIRIVHGPEADKSLNDLTVRSLRDTY